MYTTSSQSVRSLTPSGHQPQPEAVVRKFQPLRLAGNWEDAVAVASLLVMAATILYLVVVG
jgi:hypothetical protein